MRTNAAALPAPPFAQRLLALGSAAAGVIVLFAAAMLGFSFGWSREAYFYAALAIAWAVYLATAGLALWRFRQMPERLAAILEMVGGLLFALLALVIARAIPDPRLYATFLPIAGALVLAGLWRIARRRGI